MRGVPAHLRPTTRAMIFSDVAATVGKTPMVKLTRVPRGLPGRIFGKLEMRNPCGGPTRHTCGLWKSRPVRCVGLTAMIGGGTGCSGSYGCGTVYSLSRF
jgi:hypothetical protein